MLAQVQVRLHLESFRNIDLRSQGIYQVRLSASVTGLQCAQPLLPFDFVIGDRSSSSFVPNEMGRIDDGTSQLYSSCFRIQFTEQELLLNESCSFLIEVDPALVPTAVFKAELYFAEFSNKDAAMKKPIPTASELLPVSSVTFHLNHLLHGTHAMVPIVFDPLHFCSVNLLIHTAVTDFKPRSGLTGTDLSKMLFVGLAAQSGSELVQSIDDVRKYYINILIRSHHRLCQFFRSLHSNLRPLHQGKHSRYQELHQVNTDPIDISETQSTPGAVEAPVDTNQMMDQLMHSINVLSSQILPLWQALLTIAPLFHSKLASLYFENWLQDAHSKFGEFVFRRRVSLPSISAPSDSLEMSLIRAAFIRHLCHNPQRPALSIEENHLRDNFDKCVVFVEERVQPDDALSSVDFQVADQSPSSDYLNSIIAQCVQNRFLFPLTITTDSIPSPVMLSSPLRHRHLNGHFPRTPKSPQPLMAISLSELPVRSEITIDPSSVQLNVQSTEASTACAVQSASTSSPTAAKNSSSSSTLNELSNFNSNKALSFTQLTLSQVSRNLVMLSETKHTCVASHLNTLLACVHSQVYRDASTSDQIDTFPISTLPACPYFPLDIDSPFHLIGRSEFRKCLELVQEQPQQLKDHFSCMQPYFQGPSTDELQEPKTVLSPHLTAVQQLQPKHVVIFVHGFQGNSWDLRLFRNVMSLHFPDAFCRCSSINEANTQGDIGAMGRLLADEVLNIVQEVGDVRRLSFVGHSMGGLIIRAALACQDMQPLLPKLYTLVTLATPHCGYLFGPSVLLASGITLLQKWSYSHSLAQVSLRDHEDPRQCYLFQLAQRTELSHFRQVLLLSSPEDHYSPYHSARIEHHDLSDEPWDPIYEELVDHIWSSLAQVPVSRIDVAFPQSLHRVDSAIGRAAHISFLENEQFIWRFLALYRKYFM